MARGENEGNFVTDLSVRVELLGVQVGNEHLTKIGTNVQPRLEQTRHSTVEWCLMTTCDSVNDTNACCGEFRISYEHTFL